MSYNLGKVRGDFCVSGRERETILELAFELKNMLLQIFRLKAKALNPASITSMKSSRNDRMRLELSMDTPVCGRAFGKSAPPRPPVAI
jgi:hypothetical protein